jgi:hypothetical protein
VDNSRHAAMAVRFDCRPANRRLHRSAAASLGRVVDGPVNIAWKRLVLGLMAGQSSRLDTK